MELISKSYSETKKIAGELAKKLIKKRFKKAIVMALEGELGAGKTTFIKGFSKALGVKEKVLSPTFVLIHRHKIKKSGFKNLYHIDAYRLKSEKDLLKLGTKEIFANPQNIVMIEWADRVKKAIPENTILIRIKHLKKNERKISINKL